MDLKDLDGDLKGSMGNILGFAYLALTVDGIWCFVKNMLSSIYVTESMRNIKLL